MSQIVSPGRDSNGKMRIPTASVCSTVLSLPPRPAGITPCRITTNRITVTPTSRTRMMTVTHQGTIPMTDSPIRAIPSIALSAIGSATLPKSVTCLRRRARSPSMLSVTMATPNTTSAASR